MKYQHRLRPVPVLFEPSLTKFAAMLTRCDLLLTSDTGPMHLAYSLGVKTVAIFLQNTFGHWAPPADLCRVLYGIEQVTPRDVLTVFCEELSESSLGPTEKAYETRATYAPQSF